MISPGAGGKPFDARLLRHVPGLRRYLIIAVAIGVAETACIVTVAELLARIIVTAMGQTGGADLGGPAAWLAVAFAGRAGLRWLAERLGARTAVTVRSQLRRAVLTRVVADGPRGLERRLTGDLLVTVTRGVEALDGYFVRYLPQMVLSALLPIAIIGWVFRLDRVSALILLVTVPLVPLFGYLVGSFTKSQVETRWGAVAGFGALFLEHLRGIPTLKLFGRTDDSAEDLRRASEEMRSTTVATMRVVLLSALVLELLAALATALVAAGIGLRLVGGSLTLRAGLAVLLLTPEVYRPLRAAAAEFHANVEGLGAASSLLDILEAPSPVPGVLPAPNHATATLRFENVGFRYTGAGMDALADIELEIAPRERVAIVGASGAGKSTLLGLLLGFGHPDRGRLTVGGIDLADLDLAAWRRGIAWVPQDPHLFQGSLLDNLRAGALDVTVAGASAALAAVGGAEIGGRDGLERTIEEGGRNLSAGERSRVAIARTMLRDAPIVLLDEPSAHLDLEHEEVLKRALEELTAGKTVLIATHRPMLLESVDRVVVLEAGRCRSLESAGGRA